MEDKEFKVLVIDDEKEISEMICESLELIELNIKTFTATDGVDGLNKLNNMYFDLVITDIKMPKMDGRELLSQIKLLPKDLRPKNIIVASGLVEKEMLKDTPGGISIIKKPFTVKSLNHYVDVILSSKKKKKKSTVKKKPATLNVEFINPFIDATLEVLEVMAMVKAQKDFVFVKEDNENLGDITGLVPINSEKFIGSMALTFPEEVYLKVMESMMGEEYTEIDEENADGVAELCNQIFGNSKAVLSKKGIHLDMTIPTVITGRNHKINHTITGNVLGVYFKTDFGTFIVECVVAEK